MNVRIAIHLAGRGLEDASMEALGQAKHVDRAHHAGLRRLNGVTLIVNRRSRTGEIVDLVDLHIERERHVMAKELEGLMREQLIQVRACTCQEIIDAENFISLFDQPSTEMRPYEPGPTRYEDALHCRCPSGSFPGLTTVSSGR
jgi:hypothetical protein